MLSIYLVEDDALALDTLRQKSVFLDCGFSVCGYAADPTTALDEILAARPSAVITDLKMPLLSGVQMMERLQAAGCAAQFVILSAYSEFAEVRRFFTKSGFDYLIKPASDDDLAELLNRLAEKISGRHKPQTITTRSPQFNEVIDFLEQYYAMHHTLESLGERFNIRPSTLCNLFARRLSTTFSAYLNNLRMRKAEALLANTGKSIKEIAISCGYSDYFYFCRIFRKQYNCTPTQYREASAHGE